MPRTLYIIYITICLYIQSNIPEMPKHHIIKKLPRACMVKPQRNEISFALDFTAKTTRRDATLRYKSTTAFLPYLSHPHFYFIMANSLGRAKDEQKKSTKKHKQNATKKDNQILFLPADNFTCAPNSAASCRRSIAVNISFKLLLSAASHCSYIQRASAPNIYANNTHLIVY